MGGEDGDVDREGFALASVVRRRIHPVDQHKGNVVAGGEQRQGKVLRKRSKGTHRALLESAGSAAVLDLYKVEPQGMGQIARDFETKFDFGGGGCGRKGVALSQGETRQSDSAFRRVSQNRNRKIRSPIPFPA